MKHMTAAMGVLLLSSLALGQGRKEKLGWMKYEQARQFAFKLGKPILIYSVGDTGAAVDMNNMNNPQFFNAGIDVAFVDELDRTKAAKFILVKAVELKTQKAVGGGNTEVIIQDPDGELVHKATATSIGELEAAVDEALGKYAPKPIAWEAYPGNLGALRDSKKLLILLFAQEDKVNKENEETLKALEDPWIAKLHAKCAFQKVAFAKDSDVCKKWGVSSAPILLLVDPSKEAGNKAEIQRISGKNTVPHMKVAIDKAIRRIEKGS